MSQAPGNETNSTPATGSAVAPSTPGGSSTSAAAGTPSSASKLRMMAALAGAADYSPSKPAAPTTPTYTPSKQQHVPEQQPQQAHLPPAVYMTTGYGYPSPYPYYAYQQSPYMAAPQHAQQPQHAGHHPNLNPVGPVRMMAPAAAYVPTGYRGPMPGAMHQGTYVPSNAAAAAPTAPTTEAHTSPSSNAAPATEAAPTTPATEAKPAATTPTVSTPAATASTPATTPVAADASKDASLAVPKDSRSALTSSGETSLQPPIRKAKASTAAPAADKPKETNESADKPKETAKASTAAATSSAKPSESNGAKQEPAKTETAPVKMTAAEIVKASTAKAAAAAAAQQEKLQQQQAALHQQSQAKPLNPLAESLDINFEVEEPVKKPVAATTTAAPAAAKTSSPAPAATATETKPAAVVAPAESKPAVVAESKPAPVVAAPAAAEPAKTEVKSEKVAEPVKASPPAAALATPEPAARSPSPTPVTPVPYKVTVEDQQAAKKNESASVPPGIRVYSAEMLMGFAALAKGATPPPNLQIALDRARVNSPARGPGGKGAGGAGGKGRGGRADKSKGPPPTPVRPVGIDPNSIEAKARTFRGILNKITPETFEKLVDKLLEVPVENPETLASLVDIIVDVAVRELKFCAMYANLCSRIAIAFKFEQEAEDGTKYAITFRSVILNKCQGLFSDRKAVQSVPAEITDIEQRQEFEIRENKQRSHLLGLVKFVAELANQSVLSMNIVPQILDQLWAAKLGYEDLELFTIVLSTSGKQLPSAKLFIQKCRDWIKEFTEREVQDSEGIRIRYLMQNVADLADSNYVHREASSAAQGPKTLDEIRDDMAKKEKMLENELKNMKRGPVSGGGRLAQPVPSKAGGGRGPSSFSVMQRDAPRTPSSPSQGGRGKASFTAQSGGANGAFSPARGSSSSNATPAASVTSAHTLSNAFDSLMIDSQFDPNFLTASNSSAPRDENEPESARGTADGVMDTETLDESLEEFLDSAVPEDAVETIADGPAVEESCVYFISNLLLKVFDTTPDKKRDDWAINLLTLFVKNTDYGLSDTDRTVVPGLISTVEQLDSLDSPLAPGRLGSILGECLNRKIILPNAINKILAPLAGDENAKRAMQVIVSMWKRVTPTEVAGFIKASGFNISAWKIPDSELPESMKQQMETADGLLKRGVDILEVVVWAKKAGSPALRDIKFIEKLITRLSEESRAAATTKAPLDENKFAPAVSAILSAANNDLQRQIATLVITTFAPKPSQGVPLFTLLANNGLNKKTIMDAAEKKGDNYLFDPQFTSWGYSGAAAAAAASSSSSKSGKGGKGKKKK